MRFTPSYGQIYLRIDDTTLPSTGRAAADDVRATIRVEVCDEGAGIPDDEFEKFVQSSNTRTGAGGTGLGLPISREITQHHGDTLRALRHQAVGSVFELVLPREPALGN